MKKITIAAVIFLLGLTLLVAQPPTGGPALNCDSLQVAKTITASTTVDATGLTFDGVVASGQPGVMWTADDGKISTAASRVLYLQTNLASAKIRFGAGCTGLISDFVTGVVGIGSAAPTAPLHVIGDVTLSGGLYTGGNSTTKGSLRISTAGRHYHSAYSWEDDASIGAIADNTATTIITWTTTNETGDNDAGFSSIHVTGGIVASDTSDANSSIGLSYRPVDVTFSRWSTANGASTVTIDDNSGAIVDGNAGVLTMDSATWTVVDSSSYVKLLQLTVDIAGSEAGNCSSEFVGKTEVTYAVYTTAPTVVP